MDNHRRNPPLLKVEDHLVHVMRHIIVRKLQHQITIASIGKENIILIECRQQLPVNPNLLARKDHQWNIMVLELLLELLRPPNHILLVIDIPPVHLMWCQKCMGYPVLRCLSGQPKRNCHILRSIVNPWQKVAV